MGLLYVFGGAGYGKTFYCLNKLTSLSQTNEKLIFLVPEQFTLETEKSLCRMSKGGAITTVSTLSFQRLAFRLFSEQGVSFGSVLDDCAKSMILRKIVTEFSNDLDFFKKSVDKTGFIEHLNLVFREFFQYNITLKDLASMSLKCSENENLSRKIKDLHLIFKRYLEFLEDIYISAEQTLDLVPEKVSSSSLLENATVFIDGFHSFTPQEFRIIEKLLKKCENVVITFTNKSDKVSYDDIKITDPFFEVKLTINDITKIAKENDIKIYDPIYLTTNYRHKSFKELAFFERNFFNYKFNEHLEESQDLLLSASQNKIEETAFICKLINNYVRNKGLKYSEIVVLCPSSAEYENLIKEYFNLYDIPFFMDTKNDVFSSLITEAIRSLVDIFCYNFNYESVFRLLKTGVLPIDLEDIDILENFVLQYGVKGYKWQDDFTFGFESGLYSNDLINGLREKIVSYLNIFKSNVPKTKNAIKDYCIAIYKFLEGINVLNKLDEEEQQVLSKINVCFEKMVEILGEEKVSISVFSKILEEGLLTLDLGKIPPTLDQVIIADLERSRLPEIKAMFVLGANEGLLPPIKNEDGLFSDFEREKLLSEGFVLAKNSKTLNFLQQFLLYTALMKPSEHMVISYCLADLKSKAIHPCSTVSKITKLFPKISYVNEIDSFSNATAEFSNAGLMLVNLLKDNLPSHKKQLYSWFKTNENYKDEIEKLEYLATNLSSEVFLSNRSKDMLYPKNIYTSISKLEQYVKCPYAYFMRYNLTAKERKLYEASAIDYGNFFHKLIELYSTTLNDKGIKFAEADDKTINEVVDTCVDFLAPNLSEAIYLSSAKFKYMLKRMSGISKKSIQALTYQAKKGTFDIKGVEVDFGINAPISSISVSINETQQFLLTGTVDRIDLTTIDGDYYVKIIDYKTGNISFSLDDVYLGTQLQLFMYLDTLLKQGKEFFGIENMECKLLPGGVFYFNVKDETIKTSKNIDANTLKQMVLSSFKMQGCALKDEKVIKAFDKDFITKTDVLKAKINKDGSFSKDSNVESLEIFDKIREHVLGKVAEIGSHMVSGDISVSPMKDRKGNAPCEYCDFYSACKKDMFLSENIFR